MISQNVIPSQYFIIMGERIVHPFNNITTTYLSRVVRQVSGGRTVVDYINQMLLMEATFLLRQTSLSITQISDQLHFAEVTTFARFFNRMQGMTPREFRKGE